MSTYGAGFGDHVMYHTGLAGKDDTADAVLGGASDFMSDITAKMMQWYMAKDDEKVLCCTDMIIYIIEYTNINFM